MPTTVRVIKPREIQRKPGSIRKASCKRKMQWLIA